MSFQDEQSRLLEGTRNNARRVSSATKTVIFKLDNALSKNDFNGNNIFSVPFKSFWISNSSKNFQAKMILNPKGDAGDPMPLRKNMSLCFPYKENGCAIECEAQPGAWIEVIFAFDFCIIPGNVEYEATANAKISEGTAFSDGNVSIANSGTSVLLASKSDRSKATVQNNSGQPIWVGTPANLAHADYKKRCLMIDSGSSFEWKNTAQLNARVETTTTDEIAVMEQA